MRHVRIKPQEGNVRVKIRFLIFPKCIEYSDEHQQLWADTRWLSTESWIEQFTRKQIGHAVYFDWCAIEWL